MVKQFTIPCQFGNETSPVTLYIGHPEATHHPVSFQSQWLSSARGGQIPPDLMDTLQKLHDLAVENNADFEELCYYALISATNNSAGSGVSPDDINKYADEFVKKEANGEHVKTPEETQTDDTDTNTPQQQTNADNNDNNTNTANVNTSKSEPTQQPADITDEDAIFGALNNNMTQEQQNKIQDVFKQLGGLTNDNEIINKIAPTFSSDVIPTEQQQKTETNEDNNDNNDNNTSSISSASANVVADAVSAVYSQEDEDLLLMDDMVPIDNIINNENNNTVNVSNENQNNENDNNTTESAYSPEDEDLLG